MEPDLFAHIPNASPPATKDWPEPEFAPPHGLPLYLGTSSWSSDDWRGSIYPVDAKSSDYLSHYARKFMAVEIDMTFYRIPTHAMVEAWHQRTPAGFRFATILRSFIVRQIGL